MEQDQQERKEKIIEKLLALGIYKIEDTQLYKLPIEKLEREYKSKQN
ncbi:Fur-regulated basic protein FbpA [Evansella halocellulosilytica]|nr:Fur-regulated basic protein FbpA [Evansella halocellulosilytica]